MGKSLVVAADLTVIIKVSILALRFKGYKVEAVDNSKEAIEVIEKEKFDMAVIDLKILAMDGYELLPRIRKDESSNKIPVVILAEANNKKIRDTALAPYISGFIVKPFQPQEFISKVEEVLK